MRCGGGGARERETERTETERKTRGGPITSEIKGCNAVVRSVRLSLQLIDREWGIVYLDKKLGLFEFTIKGTASLIEGD